MLDRRRQVAEVQLAIEAAHEVGLDLRGFLDRFRVQRVQLAAGHLLLGADLGETVGCLLLERRDPLQGRGGAVSLELRLSRGCRLLEIGHQLAERLVLDRHGGVGLGPNPGDGFLGLLELRAPSLQLAFGLSGRLGLLRGLVSARSGEVLVAAATASGQPHNSEDEQRGGRRGRAADKG